MSRNIYAQHFFCIHLLRNRLIIQNTHGMDAPGFFFCIPMKGHPFNLSRVILPYIPRCGARLRKWLFHYGRHRFLLLQLTYENNKIHIHKVQMSKLPYKLKDFGLWFLATSLVMKVAYNRCGNHDFSCLRQYFSSVLY